MCTIRCYATSYHLYAILEGFAPMKFTKFIKDKYASDYMWASHSAELQTCVAATTWARRDEGNKPITAEPAVKVIHPYW